jgi:hypothetical protein
MLARRTANHMKAMAVAPQNSGIDRGVGRRFLDFALRGRQQRGAGGPRDQIASQEVLGSKVPVVVDRWHCATGVPWATLGTR